MGDENLMDDDFFDDEKVVDKDINEDIVDEENDIIEEDDIVDEDDIDLEEDKEEKEEIEDEKTLEVDATEDGQKDRMLSIIENMQNDHKKETKKVDESRPDIYASDAFKNVLNVLDMDEDEGKVFVAFMQQLQNDTQQKAVQQAMIDTPEVVNKYVNRNAVLTNMRKKFYEDNPQLEAVSSYVSAIANDISAKDAGMAMEDVLKEAATKAYKALNIKKEIVKDMKKSGGRKPAFAKGTKGSRKKTPKKNKLQSDINDLLNL